MTRLAAAFSGSGLFARVLRSTSWVLIGYGGSQALRLASNLILTRLLFPEAFGLMALVSVVTVGLMLFSDVGISPSIAQSKRGDDPDFLNTAWTIQVIRGVALFVIACLVTGPVAQFYSEPDLNTYLPIAAVALLVSGFNPTRIETANRHLLIGRLTVLDLISQVVGLVFMIVMAMITQSIMSLVLGSVIQEATKLVLTHFFLPGARNAFRWEKEAVAELAHLGKWIFLSTGLAFLISQGDRAILGRFLSLEMLGLYNIGFFLGSFPSMLGFAINQRIAIPIYRDKPAFGNAENQRKHQVMRVGMTSLIAGMLLVMAFAGPALVAFMYDDRYLLSGPIVTLVSLALIPQVIGMTYDQAALAAGDGRSFFILNLIRASLQITAILIGITQFGLIGAILAIGVVPFLVYPVQVWLARKHHAWGPLHDLVAVITLAVFATSVMSFHWDKTSLISQL